MAFAGVARVHNWEMDGKFIFRHVKLEKGGWFYKHPTTDGACWEHGNANLSSNRKWCIKKPALADRMMWRHDAVLRAIETGRAIYWCEGEKDANKAIDAWGVCATSHHNGSGMASNAQIELIARHRGTLRLVMDADPAGVDIAWTHAVRLQAAGVLAERIHFYQPAEGFNDLYLHIKGKKGRADLVERTHAEIEAMYKKVIEAKRRNPGTYYGSCGADDLEALAAINSPDWSER
ncbi:toprim domain-containing protein [Spirillospora sp. NPDC049024]